MSLWKALTRIYCVTVDCVDLQHDPSGLHLMKHIRYNHIRRLGKWTSLYWKGFNQPGVHKAIFQQGRWGVTRIGILANPDFTSGHWEEVLIGFGRFGGRIVLLKWYQTSECYSSSIHNFWILISYHRHLINDCSVIMILIVQALNGRSASWLWSICIHCHFRHTLFDHNAYPVYRWLALPQQIHLRLPPNLRSHLPQK
jgi:hypothetical protein